MEHPIGIIGGMGPMASQLFYQMVTEHTAAERDQDHVDLILLSDASMPDRTAAILSEDYAGVEGQLLADARLLERCGCAAIAITCNTAHFFADRIAGEVGIPILHMVRETAELLARRCPGGRVGVLATEGTVRTGLYQSALTRLGLVPWTPPPELQGEVTCQIYGRVKRGLPHDGAGWQRLEDACRAAGCAAVVLACTELSVIKAEAGLGDWYVDPLEVLARKVIETAGKTWR